MNKSGDKATRSDWQTPFSEIEIGTRLSRNCTNDVRLSLGNCNSSGKCLGAEELARSLEQRYKRGQNAFNHSVKRCVIGEGKSAYLLGHRT